MIYNGLIVEVDGCIEVNEDESLRKIYLVISMAEKQQAAVNKALDGLARERETLAAVFEKNVAVVKDATTALNRIAAGVSRSVKEAIPELQSATEAAVGVAVKDSLAGASETALHALESATAPLLTQLNAVNQQAQVSERRLRSAVGWFSWKWAVIAGCTGLLVVVLLGYASWMVFDFKRDELKDLKNQIAVTKERLEQLNISGARAEAKWAAKRKRRQKVEATQEVEEETSEEAPAEQ